MIKPIYPKGVLSISIIAALLLASFTIFYSCDKSKTHEEDGQTLALKPAAGDRLLSVANVYYTSDGTKAEAWFYESPQVFEFDATASNAKSNFETLKYAMENKVPVNVRLAAATHTQISLIIPSTAEQRASFKAEAAKKVAAEAVPNPDGQDQTTQNKVAATPVVPNIATLNTIFNKVRAQACDLPGPYTYGQCIPFQYVADGCYARAHKARQIIEDFYGYTSYKVFNYACNGAGTLSVKATLWGNNCCVKWWYHVASYVIVQDGASQVAYVIDPSMFTGPVTIATWVAAQKNVSCGYAGAAQGQVYYTSPAYAPSSLNTGTCTLTPFADNTYTSANSTCASYAPLRGCF